MWFVQSDSGLSLGSNVMAMSEVQPEKQLEPIISTEDGMQFDASDEQRKSGSPRNNALRWFRPRRERQRIEEKI
jgi:hypothetical protein